MSVLIVGQGETVKRILIRQAAYPSRTVSIYVGEESGRSSSERVVSILMGRKHFRKAIKHYENVLLVARFYSRDMPYASAKCWLQRRRRDYWWRNNSAARVESKRLVRAIRDACRQHDVPVKQVVFIN